MLSASMLAPLIGSEFNMGFLPIAVSTAHF